MTSRPILALTVLCGIAAAPALVVTAPTVFGTAVAQTTATQAFIQQLHWARAGKLDAQLFVAKAYVKGEIVERDIQQAVGWYLRAAKKGNLEAQFQVAKIFHAGANGVKRQPLAAVKLYKAAAKRGHPGAQNWLGYAYQHGHGVIKDYSIAADWYKNSAGQGLADAQNNLALLYLVGNGVEQNHARAADWFQKAADQGHSFAMNNLAGMYEIGWGVERDAERARKLYLASAITGNKPAIENLKRLGVDVPAEALEQANLVDQQRVTATLNPVDEEDTPDDDPLFRGELIGDAPALDASDQEFDEWLAEQDALSEEIPDNRTRNASDDPFDFLRKNWNRVNRNRVQRRSPSESLR